MSDRNDMVLPKEDRSLTVNDLIVHEVSSTRDYEQLITVNVYLRELVRLQRVFDGQWM
jgi:hypothetical protein